MAIFYYFTILCALVSSINIKSAYRIMIIGCILALILLPDTGWDYSDYQHAYDNAYFTDQFPWFWTRSHLTSEPFYLWYTSFWGVILPLEFPFYLAINFIICFFLAQKIFSYFPNQYKYYFWIMFLPVIFPTIFYWSPRSSISFFLILLGFTTLTNNKYWIAGLAFFGGIMIHSQFILITFLIIITYLLFNRKLENTKYYSFLIVIISIVLFIILINIERLTSLLISLLSFLPSSAVITSKMGYFESESFKGIRVTSLLSIIVYPILAVLFTKYVTRRPEKIFFLVKRNDDIILTYLLLAVIIYGAIINLAFLHSTHIAGRLSRFSDYVGMGILIPTYFRTVTKSNIAKLIIILFALLAPLLYKSLYANVNWGF